MKYRIGDKVKKGGFKVGDIVEFTDDDGELVEIQISFVPANVAGREDVVVLHVEASDEDGKFVQ